MPFSSLCRCFLFLGVFLSQTENLLAQKKEGKRYALSVGVNEYDHAKLRALRYAENDATEMAETLSKGGYTVVVLTVETGKKNAAQMPTRANILKSLDELLKKFEKGDTILVAFAGHGLQFEGEKDCYYCPKDAKPFKSELDSLVSLSLVYEKLEKSFDGSKILLVDACRDDPSATRGRGIDADNAPRPPKGVAALFSCSAGQRAFESDKLKHGVFFHHVLQALKGKAGANEKGELTFGRLAEYVPGEVEESVPSLIGGGAKQSPNQKADLSGRSPVVLRLSNKIEPVGDGSQTLSPITDTVMKPDPKTDIGKVEPGEAKLLDSVDGPVAAKDVKAIQEAWAAKYRIKATLPIMVGGERMNFVLVPPGVYEMGGLRRVKITRPFYLSATEVKQSEFSALKGNNPSWFKKIPGRPERLSELMNIENTETFPVENVSWDDANKFMEKLANPCKNALKNYEIEVRLPTEAEWEYAARAGTVGRFHNGEKTLPLSEANVKGHRTGKGFTKECGRFKPNALGLYDMHGNVGEWCVDAFLSDLPNAEVKDPLVPPEKGEPGKRVVRGGSWKDAPNNCEITSRLGYATDYADNGTGFRVAIILPLK